MDEWLYALCFSPLLGAVGLALSAGRLQRYNGWASIACLLVPAVAAAMLGKHIQPGDYPSLSKPWIPSLGIGFSLRLDALSLPFLVNVLSVSLFAVAYGLGYLKFDKRLHLCYALLLAFAGSMVGTLLADDVFLFFVFWEAMLVSSSLLLAGWGEGERVSATVLKYFFYAQVGSLLVLVALVSLVTLTGSASLSEMQQRVALLSSQQATWLAALLLIGFCVKLAVFPLHTWLPDAHSVAPMPVTVMLAAAMLGMGAYGILRFPIGLLGSVGMAPLRLPFMLIGLLSGIYGALLSLAMHDIKRMIAYSSVSQMGYVLFAYATLTAQGIRGGTFHIISHGIIKALLFMGVGLIMRATGRKTIEELGGLAKRMPLTMVGLTVGALAISGLPPFCGFHSEWMILSSGITSAYPLLGYVEFTVPIFTAAYALWFIIRLVFNPEPLDLRIGSTGAPMHWAFHSLAFLALLVGLFPSPIYQWVERVMPALMASP